MKNLKLNSGWSYCSEQILQFENNLNKTDFLEIIEFGAGDSSIKIYDYFCQKYKNIVYTCYENDNRWMFKHDKIKLILYDFVENVNLENKKYDLILVDGPTGVSRKFWYKKIKNIVKNIVEKENKRDFYDKVLVSALKIMNNLFDKIKEEIDLEDIEIINKNVYKLPVLKNNNKVNNVVEIRKKNIEISIDVLNQNLPICNHYIKWWNILKLSKKTDTYNQAIFDYVKQYVKENDKGIYICKSCNEELYLQKYLVEGTYVEELDTFLTTNLIVNQKLEDIEKYNNFTRIIRNIEKNIERFAFILDINTLIGNDVITKLKRRTMIKDILDLISVIEIFFYHFYSIIRHAFNSIKLVLTYTKLRILQLF